MSLSRQIFILLFALLALGVISVYSASSALSLSRFQTPFFYLQRHLLSLGVGFIFFFIAYRINTQFLKNISLLLFVATLALVAMTFLTTYGVAFGGAHRWLSFTLAGVSFTFIPAEFLKITTLLYFAAILSKTDKPRPKQEFLPLFFWLALIAFLLLKQPSTAALVIVGSSLVVLYLIAGARVRHIFFLLLLGAALLFLIVASSGYRMQRISIFLNPTVDSQGAAYHINQAKIAIGSGGLFGKGFGRSASKLVIPEPFVDSIFAIYAEETGFVGSLILITLYLFLVLKLVSASHFAKDKFCRLFIFGMAVLVGIQSLINIGAIVGLLPLTGIPLPLVSFGGSSLISFLFGFGVVFNMIKRS